MTPEQIRFAARVRREQIKAGTFVADHDLPRYYIWVERPRIPDFEGGEQPIDWTREDDGGIL